MRMIGRRAGLVLLTAAGAAVVQACTSSTGPTSARKPPLGLNCIRGTIPVDATSPRTGALGPTDGCRARDPLSGESTFTHSYVFSVQAGQGYMVNMWAMNAATSLLNSRLELVSAGTSAETLLAASRTPEVGTLLPLQHATQLLFVSTATATDTIRATTVDTEPSDTGSYSIVAHVA